MPDFYASDRWKTWTAELDVKTCLPCRKMHGKIYGMEEWVDPAPPLHPNCRCKLERLKALLAGTATKLEQHGADW